MTLKEKLYDEYIWTTEPIVEAEEVSESVDKMVKIADEFAIGFAEWVGQNTINYSSGKFRMKTLKPTLFTSKELLLIYKEEKDL
jgi:hypothetical protein